MHTSYLRKAACIREFTPPAQAVYQNRRCPTTIDIAPVTGPMQPLQDRCVLLLADVENLSYSARNRLGQRISYDVLTTKLAKATANCQSHAFFSKPANAGDGLSRYFTGLGWTAHTRDIAVVPTRQGIKRLANADNLILFKAGLLISRHSADVVIIASGDGELVCDLAEAITALPKPRQVFTLSLAGSTSRRLDAERNRLIAANLEIGRDCLKPL